MVNRRMLSSKRTAQVPDSRRSMSRIITIFNLQAERGDDMKVGGFLEFSKGGFGVSESWIERRKYPGAY